MAGEGLGWETANQRLQRAVQRHGREGRAAAVRELGEQSELLVRFVERVRCGSLCERPFEYIERTYKEIWAELVGQARETGEEKALVKHVATLFPSANANVAPAFVATRVGPIGESNAGLSCQ